MFLTPSLTSKKKLEKKILLSQEEILGPKEFLGPKVLRIKKFVVHIMRMLTGQMLLGQLWPVKYGHRNLTLIFGTNHVREIGKLSP